MSTHFPMSYDEFIVHVLFKTAHYNARQDETQRLVQRLGDLPTPRWRRLFPGLFPDDVRKTQDEFCEVELTRIDNLDHELPLEDRLRPPRQRIYPIVLILD